MAHLLGAEAVHLEYPTQVVFESITLGVNDGARIGIVGRNGDGKSSLLRLLTGQQRPDSGRVTQRSGLRVGALSQASALLTRHWWPVTAAGCTVSRRLRRAAAVAALADIALEYRRDRAGLDPLRYGIARRLDDLAYGAGVWLSAARGRSTAALRPRITR